MRNEDAGRKGENAGKKDSALIAILKRWQNNRPPLGACRQSGVTEVTTILKKSMVMELETALGPH